MGDKEYEPNIEEDELQGLSQLRLNNGFDSTIDGHRQRLTASCTACGCISSTTPSVFHTVTNCRKRPSAETSTQNEPTTKRSSPLRDSELSFAGNSKIFIPLAPSVNLKQSQSQSHTPVLRRCLTAPRPPLPPPVLRRSVSDPSPSRTGLDLLRSNSDNTEPDSEEAVSVQQIGENLVIKLKCPCTKTYEILLSNGSCYYKL